MEWLRHIYNLSSSGDRNLMSSRWNTHSWGKRMQEAGAGADESGHKSRKTGIDGDIQQGKRSFPGLHGSRQDMADDDKWDGESPKKTDWSLLLQVFRCAKSTQGLTEGEVKRLGCPIGSACRFRTSSCWLEHRPEKRPYPIAEVVIKGRTIREMAIELARKIRE